MGSLKFYPQTVPGASHFISYFHVLIHLNENPDEQVLADNNFAVPKGT